MNALQVEHLRFAWADGTPALHDVTFAVGEHERVGLVGPNGAGKSTLLLHLNGLLPERWSGPPAVRVFGEPVAPPRLAEVRAQVGLLFQDPDDQLFCPTVEEDVAFGPLQLGLPASAIRERVRDALARVGLPGFETRHPQRLSVGEKRRVCLAGVLACEPRLLVLDEPTSGLDPRGRRELEGLLAALPVAQLVATHDLELVVRLCSRVVVLDRGRVVAEGPPRHVFDDEALMLAHGLERPHLLRHPHPHA